MYFIIVHFIVAITGYSFYDLLDLSFVGKLFTQNIKYLSLFLDLLITSSRPKQQT